MKTTRPYTDIDVLQTRVAARLVAGLGESAASLPHDLTERLRSAREQALDRARASRRAQLAPAVVQQGNSLLLSTPPAWWQRLASALPVLVLLAGLQFIDQWANREQVLAAAELDGSLLADTLPPAAYADPGFAEFVKSAPP
jgi:hypothetical protein